MYSDEPTLAAAAYLAKVPLVDPRGGANPSTVSCHDNLLGTASWGTSTAGGGWVNLDDDVFTVIELCRFVDMSGIDRGASPDYSEDVVRGADLAELFRFDVDEVPGYFAAPAPR